MLGIGSVVDGKYKILSEVGHGGMSVVYLAINERANKTWAVKEVRKDGSNGSEVVQQGLVAETEMLKKLDHPNLPSIVDVIDQDDSFLIVMDFIEGRSLKDLLDHGGPQEPDKVVEWAKQLCDVLGYLHSRTPPIIYRDMKPANVMLEPSGRVKLIDFGTAREYKVGHSGDTTWLGTRGYAAPEQFGDRGQQTDARTDIYCLGATIYHLLTGYSPADTNLAILPLRQLNPAFAGTGLEKIVAKCCEPDPRDRYQNCAELMYALEHVHDADDEAMRRRNTKWWAFCASVGIALLGAVGMVGFRLAANRATANSYEYFVRQAQNSGENITEAAEYYRQAIDLRPSEADAYETMLTAIETDMVFTTEESAALRRCIMDTDGGTRSNLSYFESSNHRGYDAFVYRLANDYYFFYEGSDNRAQAANWYGEVLESQYLTDQQRELANSLYTIGNYYSALGSDRSVYAVGEDTGSYLTFWNQMVALTDGDVVAKTGGTRYAVALYREMVTQIYNNTARFKAFGITQSDMQAQLDKVERGMQDLVPESTTIADQMESTTALIAQARQMVDTTFASVSAG